MCLKMTKQFLLLERACFDPLSPTACECSRFCRVSFLTTVSKPDEMLSLPSAPLDLTGTGRQPSKRLTSAAILASSSPIGRSQLPVGYQVLCDSRKQSPSWQSPIPIGFGSRNRSSMVHSLSKRERGRVVSREGRETAGQEFTFATRHWLAGQGFNHQREVLEEN
jgi:hypothetical protein